MIYENGFYDVDQTLLFDFDDDADFIKRDSHQSRGFADVRQKSRPIAIPTNVDSFVVSDEYLSGTSITSGSSGSIITFETMKQAAIEVDSPLCGECGSSPADWYTDGIHGRHRQLHHDRHLLSNNNNNQHNINNNNNSRGSSWLCQRHSAGSQQLQSFAESMVTLEELKDHFNSCFTCGVSWAEEHVSLDCLECGGYSMERPCPLCDGKCDNVWRRDLTMTHALRKAHWEGECGLATREQEAIFLKNLVDVAEDSLTKALKDLNASPSS